MTRNNNTKIQKTAGLKTAIPTKTVRTVKAYVEQHCEIRRKGFGAVRYQATDDAHTVHYKVRRDVIAVLRNHILSIFEDPVKPKVLRGDSMPLGVTEVRADRITVCRAMCCRKCKVWAKLEDVRRCRCGGYFVTRQRFSVEAPKELDPDTVGLMRVRKEQWEERRRPVTRRHVPKQHHDHRYDPHCMCRRCRDITFPESRPEKQPVRPGCPLLCAATRITVRGQDISEDERLSFGESLGIGMQSLMDDMPREEVKAGLRRICEERAEAQADEMFESWSNPPRARRRGYDRRARKASTVPEVPRYNSPVRVRCA